VLVAVFVVIGFVLSRVEPTVARRSVEESQPAQADKSTPGQPLVPRAEPIAEEGASLLTGVPPETNPPQHRIYGQYARAYFSNGVFVQESGIITNEADDPWPKMGMKGLRELSQSERDKLDAIRKEEAQRDAKKLDEKEIPAGQREADLQERAKVLAVGLTKEQVVQIMGNPDHITADFLPYQGQGSITGIGNWKATQLEEFNKHTGKPFDFDYTPYSVEEFLALRVTLFRPPSLHQSLSVSFDEHGQVKEFKWQH